MSSRFRMNESTKSCNLDVAARLLEKSTDVSTSNYYTNENKMLILCRRYLPLRTRRRILGFAIKCVLSTLIFLYVVVPLGLYVFPSILKSLIFLNYVNRPLMSNYSDTLSFGLPATHNFYIKTAPDVEVGTWHVLPKSLMLESAGTLRATDFERSLRSGHPIVVYMHGNSGSRASSHRVDLYNVLRNLDAHVIAFDYRGYGDSSPVDVSEEALVHDAKEVYKWVRERAGSSPIFVWGHSLGTGVATHGVSELCQEGNAPKGLILEAPFNNMSDEVVEHPFSTPFRLAPWYKWAAVSALKTKSMMFDSDKHISGVTSPTVILHAEDDSIIPLELGLKLYEASVDGRPKTVITSLITFKKELGYGHRNICRDPDLPLYIGRFMKNPEMKLT